MDRDPIILHSTCLFFQITPRSPSASPHHFPPTGIGKELQKRNEIVAEKKKTQQNCCGGPDDIHCWDDHSALIQGCHAGHHGDGGQPRTQ